MRKKTRKHLCCQKYILPRHWQCIRCALWYRVLLQGVQVLSNPILWCNLVGVGALTSHKYTSGRINIWKHTLEKNQTNASGLRDYEGMHLSKGLAFIKKMFVFHVQKVLNQLNNASSFTSLGTKKIYIGSWGASSIHWIWKCPSSPFGHQGTHQIGINSEAEHLFACLPFHGWMITDLHKS